MRRDCDFVLYDLYRADCGYLPEGCEAPSRAEGLEALATWKALSVDARLRRAAERLTWFPTLTAALDFLSWCNNDAEEFLETWE